MMKRPTRITVLAMLAAISGNGCATAGERPDGEVPASNREFVAADVGRNAGVVLSTDLRVQELLRRGEQEEALRALNSAYLYQISLLREFDRELSGDERHVRLRNKVVEKLKRLWLAHPPEYLDEASAAFIEATCATIPDCPPGKLVGRKPLPDEPR